MIKFSIVDPRRIALGTDFSAFVFSYGIRLSIPGGRCFLQMPIAGIEALEELRTPVRETPAFEPVLLIQQPVKVALFDCGDLSDPESNFVAPYRSPFFVERPLTVLVAIANSSFEVRFEPAGRFIKDLEIILHPGDAWNGLIAWEWGGIG